MVGGWVVPWPPRMRMRSMLKPVPVPHCRLPPLLPPTHSAQVSWEWAECGPPTWTPLPSC